MGTRIAVDARQQCAARNAVLKQLGFSSYTVYQHSTLWKKIRLQVLLPHARCRACGRPATQVHHHRYHLEDMDGTNLTHLIPVCGSCHHKAEFTKAGLKVGPQHATNRLDEQRIEHQKIWHKQDAADAWKHFFATIEKLRIFVGMDGAPEARCLAEELDAAMANLPPRRPKQPKNKKRRHRTG